MLGGQNIDSDTANISEIKNNKTARNASSDSQKDQSKPSKIKSKTSQCLPASPRGSSPAAKTEKKLLKQESLEQSLPLKDTEPKRTPVRSKTRGRPSIPTNPTLNQDADGQTEDSKLEVPAISDAQNTDKESASKNVMPGYTTKAAAASTSKSLKTLETYIETMGIDVPSNRHLLAYNRVGKVRWILIAYVTIQL